MNNKHLDPREFKTLFFIRDRIMYHSKSPSLRAIQEHLGQKSPRSASLIIDRLESKGYLERTPQGNIRLLKDIDGSSQKDRTIEIPLVGSAPCGLPLLAEENVEAMIPVSQKIARPGAKYFLLRAVGNSMDEAGIKSGDLVLVRQQPVAENGDRVVALIGDDTTIKEFHRKEDKVILKPRTSEPSKHQPIILDGGFFVQGVVVSVISNPYK